jgi:hypothetical protein
MSIRGFKPPVDNQIDGWRDNVQTLPNSSGSLAIFAAIHRSLLSWASHRTGYSLIGDHCGEGVI